MSDSYTPQEIEPRWQQRWAETNLYRQVIDTSKPKHYALTMLLILQVTCTSGTGTR